MKTNACHNCKHLRKETESYEMPYIWWGECRAGTGFENLKTFPFAETKCTKFEEKVKKVTC